MYQADVGKIATRLDEMPSPALAPTDHRKRTSELTGNSSEALAYRPSSAIASSDSTRHATMSDLEGGEDGTQASPHSSASAYAQIVQSTAQPRTKGHARSPSASMAYTAGPSNPQLHRSGSSSSHLLASPNISKREGEAEIPSGGWSQRLTPSKYGSRTAASPSIVSRYRNRNRSGSLISNAGSERSIDSYSAALPDTSNNFASFRRSLSRRPHQTEQQSSNTVDRDFASSRMGTNDDMMATYVDSHPKEKRRLFAKGKDGKGVLRRVSSRSIFGSKDRDIDRNASCETLASSSTSSTARNGGLGTRDSDNRRLTTQSPRRLKNGPELALHSDGRKDTLNLQRVYDDPPIDAAMAKRDEAFMSSMSASPSTLTNEQHDRSGEGMPKRFSGWLSSMIGSSAGSSQSLDRESNMPLSSGLTQVRRKTSALSLNRSDDANSSTIKHQPEEPGSASKARGSSMLAALSASGRSRVDLSPSPGASNGGNSTNNARSGLDRALRYFLDNGEQNIPQMQEPIWLLGVQHGGSRDADDDIKSPLVGPSIAIEQASPEGGKREGSTRRADLPAKSLGPNESSRRQRETSPSIASISTGNSSDILRAANGTVDRDTLSSFKEDEHTPDSDGSAQQTAQPALRAIEKQGQHATRGRNTGHPASFQEDFSSIVWCTYRSQFVPIARDGTISKEAERAAADAACSLASSVVGEGRNVHSVQSDGHLESNVLQIPATPGKASRQYATHSTPKQHQRGTLGSAMGMTPSQSTPHTSTAGLGDKMGIPGLWSRATAAAQAYGLSGRSGLTTDAGWGCMLRTGQSVLANALLQVHLRRGWRAERKLLEVSESEEDRSSHNLKLAYSTEYARYVKLLTWFMDEPSLACPFGVHRMAREGKRLGKEVGEWFGPSTAAGAIKKLVDDYPAAGLGVNLATDGVVYLDQVRSQSCLFDAVKKQGDDDQRQSSWKRPVLILIGIRLGLDGVHPMYFDSIKATFTLPQSVGIAGGRPSSSYYFVGHQGNSLFYLDPHQVRPSVPFRHPPPEDMENADWWINAYSEAELSSFHNDRPRRMPMKSLDPSMLLGFLLKDEADLQDFSERVKRMPRPIFSVFDKMPAWMMEDEDGDNNGMLLEDDKALESFSEGSLGPETTPDEHQDQQNQNHALGGDSNGARVAEEASNSDARDIQRRRTEPSTLSISTMTPRSESTFEFVDRQPSIGGPSTIGTLPSAPISVAASRPRQQIEESGQYTPSASLHDQLEVAATSSEYALVSPASPAQSESTSAWVDVSMAGGTSGDV